MFPLPQAANAAIAARAAAGSQSAQRRPRLPEAPTFFTTPFSRQGYTLASDACQAAEAMVLAGNRVFGCCH